MNHIKTAISIPQDVFDSGEQLAADLGISRSDLYTRAVRAMLRERKLAAARARLDSALAYDRSRGGPPRLAHDLHGIASAAMHRAVERGESTW